MNLSKEINNMEQKTAEEFLNDMLENEIPEELNWEDMTIIAMNKFANYKAKQQQEIAVEKALEIIDTNLGGVVCNTTFERISKEILSLKPEILKELEK